MKNIKINLSSRYKRAFKKLPLEIQKKAIVRIKIFKDNPSDLRLRTHSLSGKDKDCWAFWVDYNYRIKFIFLADKEVLFLEIGTHDIYR